MKINRLKLLFRAQRGFTLIEILVAMIITVAIGAVVTTAVTEVTRVSAKSLNHQAAITQMENGVHYLSRDAQQAQTVTAAGAHVTTVLNVMTFHIEQADTFTITWIDWNTNTTNQIVYSFSNGSLLRNSVPVANNITTATGIWHKDTKVLNFTLTATVGSGISQSAESRIFQINPRPAQ